MECEFTLIPVSVLDPAIDLKQEIKKGRKTLITNEDIEDKADQDARARHRVIAPPPTVEAVLDLNENTSQQWSTTLINTTSGGSGGSASHKEPKHSAAGANSEGSFDNSDSDLGANEEELTKTKLASNQLLYKHMKAMIPDYKRRDNVDVPKLQLFKGDPGTLRGSLGKYKMYESLSPMSIRKT